MEPCHLLANCRPSDLIPVAIGGQGWDKNLPINILKYDFFQNEGVHFA